MVHTVLTEINSTMTGRGRGARLQALGNSLNSPVSSSADIKDLFNAERTPIEVYNMIKNAILVKPFDKNHVRACIEKLIKNMINNPINAVDICKALYVCSCYNDSLIGMEIWSHFYRILEKKFKELHNDLEKVSEVHLRYFTKFFIIGIQFMRNPSAPPKEDIVSAMLILINRLNKSSAEDREIYCQAVAWIASYIKCIIPGSLLTQAYTESLDTVREWIIQGIGRYWSMACVECACNGGFLPYHSVKYYNKKLTNTQFLMLSECSKEIIIPARDKNMYNLPKADCISFLDCD